MRRHLDTLAHYAMRYAFGRMSTAPSDVADAIRAVWVQLSPSTRALMIRDIAEAIHEDDLSRAEGRPYHRLGMDCDRAVGLDLADWMAGGVR